MNSPAECVQVRAGCGAPGACRAGFGRQTNFCIGLRQQNNCLIVVNLLLGLVVLEN